MRAFNDKLFGAGTPTTAEMTAAVGTNTPITVAQGGTGAATLADGGIVIGNATGVVEVVAAGATTEILVGGGAATKPAWTTATGTGAPVREGTPTFSTGIAVGGATPGTGGIAFPATAVAVADANTLDDYEEGTWTPQLGSNLDDSGQTQSSSGTYTKIGLLIIASFTCILTTKGTMGGTLVFIKGLPIDIVTGCSGNVFQAYNLGASYVNVGCFPDSGRVTMIVITATSSATTSLFSNMVVSGIQDTTVIAGAVVYLG